MDRLQLGTLRLDLRVKEEDPSLTTEDRIWLPLTSESIDAGLWTDLSTSEEMISLLAELLADPGIAFEAEGRVASPHLIVRCSLIPSDGSGSDWRKKPRKDRSRVLRRLFAELRAGWDGEGDCVMAKRVSRLMSLELISRKWTDFGSMSCILAYPLPRSQRKTTGYRYLSEMRILIPAYSEGTI
jgi:hypothetical protein